MGMLKNGAVRSDLAEWITSINDCAMADRMQDRQVFHAQLRSRSWRGDNPVLTARPIGAASQANGRNPDIVSAYLCPTQGT